MFLLALIRKAGPEPASLWVCIGKLDLTQALVLLDWAATRAVGVGGPLLLPAHYRRVLSDDFDGNANSI